MNEISKKANLTKKAIEYYTEQELVFPNVLENGYRDFCENDLERLKKISILHRLGLSTAEIKTVLADENSSNLKKFSVQKELYVQRELAKKAILDKLSSGSSYAEISGDLKAIEQSATITEKLLDAFPGYYGRFICLHFARFLNEPIITEEQQSAYTEILEFLDNVATLNFPEELKDYVTECTENISTANINDMLKNMEQAMEHPERFLSENQEILEQYLAIKQSKEYKDSPAYQIQSLLLEFNKTSGYYDTFIPNMRKLSYSYAEYSKQLEKVNEIFLAQYPEMKKLNNFNQ